MCKNIVTTIPELSNSVLIRQVKHSSSVVEKLNNEVLFKLEGITTIIKQINDSLVVSTISIKNTTIVEILHSNTIVKTLNITYIKRNTCLHI